MSKSKKILITSMIILITGILAFCITWTVLNFNAIKNVFNGTKLYTKTDIDNAYTDGKNDGFKEKNDYLLLIDGYLNQVASLEYNLAENTNSLNKLEADYSALKETRDKLQSELSENKNNYDELSIEYEAINLKCNNLLAQIEKLKNTNNELQLNINNMNNRISELEANIDSNNEILEDLVGENKVIARFYYKNIIYSVQILEKGTIPNISDPVTSSDNVFLGWFVNDVIVDVSNYVVEENTIFVAKVNAVHNVKFLVDGNEYDSDRVIDGSYSKCPVEPTKDGYVFDGWQVDNVLFDVNYYPITSDVEFIARFTKIHKVQFSYKNEIISTQFVRDGDFSEKANPVTDEYTKFNYWTVDSVKVDVTTYSITSDVIFVANYTNYYKVEFMCNNELLSEEIVSENSYPTKIANPEIENYEFDFWTIDGTTEVNPFTSSVTQHITYYAKMTKICTVTFNLKGDIISTQKIRQGDYAVGQTVTSTEREIFNGWKVLNEFVNISSYKIMEDVEFVADISYRSLVQFKVGTYIVDNQYVENNKTATSPDLTNYSFVILNNWTLDGVVVSLVNTLITKDVLFVADYSVNFTGKKAISINNMPENFVSSDVWNLDDFVYYSNGSTHLYFDKDSLSWKEKNWNGCNYFYGRYFYTYSDNYYINDDDNKIYLKLDKDTDTWSETEFKPGDSIHLFDDYYLSSTGYKVCDCKNEISYSVLLYYGDGYIDNYYKPLFKLNGCIYIYDYDDDFNTKVYKILPETLKIVYDNQVVYKVEEVSFTGLPTSFYDKLNFEEHNGEVYFKIRSSSGDYSYYLFDCDTLSFSLVDSDSSIGFDYSWTDGLFYYYYKNLTFVFI